MEFSEEEKKSMGLSDEDSTILMDAVSMVKSKTKEVRAGHIGAFIFCCHENPQETMNTLMSLIKYTLAEHALDGHKIAAAEDVVSDFQGYVDELQLEIASA